jgi:hypothetical protein
MITISLPDTDIDRFKRALHIKDTKTCTDLFLRMSTQSIDMLIQTIGIGQIMNSIQLGSRVDRKLAETLSDFVKEVTISKTADSIVHQQMEAFINAYSPWLGTIERPSPIIVMALELLGHVTRYIVIKDTSIDVPLMELETDNNYIDVVTSNTVFQTNPENGFMFVDPHFIAKMVPSYIAVHVQHLMDKGMIGQLGIKYLKNIGIHPFVIEVLVNCQIRHQNAQQRVLLDYIEFNNTDTNKKTDAIQGEFKEDMERTLDDSMLTSIEDRHIWKCSPTFVKEFETIKKFGVTYGSPILWNQLLSKDYILCQSGIQKTGCLVLSQSGRYQGHAYYYAGTVNSNCLFIDGARHSLMDDLTGHSSLFYPNLLGAIQLLLNVFKEFKFIYFIRPHFLFHQVLDRFNLSLHRQYNVNVFSKIVFQNTNTIIHSHIESSDSHVYSQSEPFPYSDLSIKSIVKMWGKHVSPSQNSLIDTMKPVTSIKSSWESAIVID